MKIHLRPRLKRISDAVIEINCLADIGTDHGYIPVKLMLEKRIKKAIAGDINPLPLEKAQLMIEENNLETLIETRLGSGLSVLKPGEVDGVVMAGMGGKLIAKLLKDDDEIAKSVQRLILQPMSGQSFLRSFLEKNNYAIIEEILVQEDRRIYEIIVVQPGLMTMDDWLEYELGYCYRDNKDPLFRDFVERKLELESRILSQTIREKTPLAKKQFNQSEQTIKALEGVIACLSS